MPKIRDDDPKLPGQGNWLGKSRRNFNIANRCWQMLHVLAMEYGLNHSSMLEICVREKYVKDIGPVPPIRYAGGGKPE